MPLATSLINAFYPPRDSPDSVLLEPASVLNDQVLVLTGHMPREVLKLPAWSQEELFHTTTDEQLA